MKPNQKLNVMLQRILRADYSFPADKPLRWAGHTSWAAGSAVSPSTAWCAAQRGACWVLSLGLLCHACQVVSQACMLLEPSAM